ncbi:hypothetical protein [Streptomyces botrytidirepellens]|uniref:Uncharacterized protein n=1 Tax=Streptomyces botrytidirepellens TaxID=2486417 RepID=A0A3M8WE97_9ACTN|nr:hypothetical protein [Streptomyces botrytidirepellens]RNG26253.1 hypothetical protein EEJ42_15765 [Streptomyces botrytidirepellens]
MKHNGRPPIRASKVDADRINLREGEKRTVVCGDCGTWRVIEGRMVAAHRAEPRSSKPRKRRQLPEDRVPRCLGSGQRIWFDITPDQWRARYERLSSHRQDQGMNPGSRRTTRVKRMSNTPPPPASKLIPSLPTAKRAFEKYKAHRNGCSTCTGRTHCTDGARLAAEYVRLLDMEPQSQRVRAGMEQLRKLIERFLAEQLPRRRATEWAAVLPDVQDADTRRTQRPNGAAPITDFDVPLKNLHPAR